MEQQISYDQLEATWPWVVPMAASFCGKSVVVNNGFPQFHDRPLINTDKHTAISRWIPDFKYADPLKSEFFHSHPLLGKLAAEPSFISRLSEDKNTWSIQRQLFWDLSASLKPSDWDKIEKTLKPFSTLDVFIKFCAATFKKNKFFNRWSDSLKTTISPVNYDLKDYNGFRLAYYTLIEQLDESHQVRWVQPKETHEFGFDNFISDFYSPQVDLEQTFRLIGHDVKST